MIVPAQAQFAQAARDARARMAAKAVCGAHMEARPKPLLPPAADLPKMIATPAPEPEPPPPPPVPPPESVWKPLLFVMAEFLAHGKKPPARLVRCYLSGLTGVAEQLLIGPRGSPATVEARRFSIWAFLTIRKDSLAGAGRMFGNRDHSTTLHARDTAAQKIAARAFPPEWLRFADHIIAGTIDELVEEACSHSSTAISLGETSDLPASPLSASQDA